MISQITNRILDKKKELVVQSISSHSKPVTRAHEWRGKARWGVNTGPRINAEITEPTKMTFQPKE